jgi:type IV secretory pathway VirB4 component
MRTAQPWRRLSDLSLGFTARIETLNAMESYLRSLPGHDVENVRPTLMNTINLADLLPTSRTKVFPG